MIRRLTVAAAALGAAGAGACALADAAPPLPTVPFAWRDGFDAGLCTGRCPGARWAIRQQERGRVDTVAAPGRTGESLRARAEPKRGSVAKAALVARTQRLPPGTTVRVAFDLWAPSGTPLDSIQLVDLECATCGEAGNPGIRLYLRRGRLRVDRSKIGVEHAWVNDAATQLRPGRWHRVEWRTRLGAGDDGRTQVLLDGEQVLVASGATVYPYAIPAADRIQIGVTANSNAVPVELLFDRVEVSAR